MFIISTLFPVSHPHIPECFPLSLFLAVAVLLAVIIILITGALAVGVFLNYKRTGSFIPSMPKLPRYLSSCIPPFPFSACFYELKCTEGHTRAFRSKFSGVFCFFCQASVAWWSLLTLGTGWRFTPVITLISDHHTLECHSLTRPCRWWVQEGFSLPVNILPSHWRCIISIFKSQTMWYLLTTFIIVFLLELV